MHVDQTAKVACRRKRQRLALVIFFAFSFGAIGAHSTPKSKRLVLGPRGNICVATVPPEPPETSLGIEDWASGAFVHAFGRRFEGRVLGDLNGLKPRPRESPILAAQQCQLRSGSITVRVTLRVDKAKDRYVIDMSGRAAGATYKDHLERERGSQWQKDKLRFVDPPGPTYDYWRARTQNAVSIDSMSMANKMIKAIEVQR